MTKKVAKKANVMSLKDFYDSAPGKTHLETLPNKSGDVPRDGDQYGLESKIADLAIEHGTRYPNGLREGSYGAQGAFIKSRAAPPANGEHGPHPHPAYDPRGPSPDPHHRAYRGLEPSREHANGFGPGNHYAGSHAGPAPYPPPASGHSSARGPNPHVPNHPSTCPGLDEHRFDRGFDTSYDSRGFEAQPHAPSGRDARGFERGFCNGSLYSSQYGSPKELGGGYYPPRGASYPVPHGADAPPRRNGSVPPPQGYRDVRGFMDGPPKGLGGPAYGPAAGAHGPHGGAAGAPEHMERGFSAPGAYGHPHPHPSRPDGYAPPFDPRFAPPPPPPPPRPARQQQQQQQAEKQAMPAAVPGALVREAAKETAAGQAAAAAAPVASSMAQGTTAARLEAVSAGNASAAKEMEAAARPRDGPAAANGHAGAAGSALLADKEQVDAMAAPTAAATATKNDFAERLAQKAMANVVKAKSSLLSGLPPAAAHSSSSMSSVAGSGAGSADEAQGPAADGGEGGKGPFVKPAHPFGRPRLVLKPRSGSVDVAPSPDGSVNGGPAVSSPSGSSGEKEREGDKGAAAGSAEATQRPKLNLQPRTAPLPVAPASAAANGEAAAEGGSWEKGKAAAAGGRPKLNLLPRGSASLPAEGCGAAGAKPSVFGAARPREEVLKERGVDADGPGGQRLSEATLARHGMAGRGSSRSGSVHSGEDTDWHMVGSRRHKAGADGAGSMEGGGSYGGLDPFSSSAATSGWQGGQRSGRYEDRGSHNYADGGSRFHYSNGGGNRGMYGSPGGGGYFGSGGYHADNEGDGMGSGLFSRALPTRQDLLIL